MNKQINLVSHKKKKLLNRDRLLRLVVFLSRISMAMVVLSAIGLFVLNRSATLPILEQQDKTITSNLSFVQQKIIKFLLIRERLQDINPLINNGSTLTTTLTDISNELPSNVSLTSVSLRDKKLSLVVSSPSLTAIGTLLDYFIMQVNKKNIYKTVTISNFTADSNSGKYTLNLDILTYE